MFRLSAQGIDEHIINVHYYYYYCLLSLQKAESMYKYVISSISMYSNCSFLEKAFIVENVLMHIILMFPFFLFFL